MCLNNRSWPWTAGIRNKVLTLYHLKRNPFGFSFSSSSTPTRKEEEGQEKGQTVLQVIIFKPSEDQWDRLLKLGDNALSFLERLSFVYVILRVSVPSSMNLFAQCRHTVQEQRYATRRVTGLILVVFSLLQYSKDGGKALNECLRKALESLYNGAELVQDPQELELARKIFEGVLNRQVIDTNIASKVSHDKFSDFAYGILEDFTKAIEDNKLEVCLDDLYNLPNEKKSSISSKNSIYFSN